MPSYLSPSPRSAEIGLVIVKKWNEGDRDFVGVSTYDGKVYLHAPNVVYVKWMDTQQPDGTVVGVMAT